MIKTEEVSARNWEALVELFASSAQCSDCWCMNHRSSPAKCPTGPAAKQALRKAITRGTATGLLAFHNGRAAGWCAIDPAGSQVGHDYSLKNGVSRDPAQWMIHCLFVAPFARGQGVSGALIDAALVLARASGAREVLAFPMPEAARAVIANENAEFSGRISSFEKRGFEKLEAIGDFYQIMRLKLSDGRYDGISWSNL